MLVGVQMKVLYLRVERNDLQRGSGWNGFFTFNADRFERAQYQVEWNSLSVCHKREAYILFFLKNNFGNSFSK